MPALDDLHHVGSGVLKISPGFTREKLVSAFLAAFSIRETTRLKQLEPFLWWSKFL